MKNLIILLFSLSFLTSCKEDLCKNVTCQNNGTCQGNGQCLCPTGYSGNFCESEKTPISITINAVRLVKFPVTKSNGAGWDVLPSSGPDLTFSLVRTTGTLVYKFPTYISNATSTSLPIIFSNPSIKVSNNISDEFAIELYDDDTPATNEFMGGISFNLYQKGKNFPKTLLLSCGTCATAWELDLTYEF